MHQSRLVHLLDLEHQCYLLDLEPFPQDLERLLLMCQLDLVVHLYQKHLEHQQFLAHLSQLDLVDLVHLYHLALMIPLDPVDHLELLVHQ